MAERGSERHLRRALELARRGAGLASPNPMVGAVVVRGGRVVGEGWHEGPGSPHAEIAALDQAGDRARGATLVVTLEPCSHHGRTPPCAPAVARAGVTQVVVGATDPNPLVDGRGLRILHEAGLDASLARGEQAEACADLIAGFARHVTTGLPFVTLKMAASLDGKVAARDGTSRWVTGEPARLDVHRLRAVSDAIVVGAGTALADDPSLTVRLDGYRGRPPLRVVVDGAGRLPAQGALFDGSAPTVIATTASAPASAVAGWEAAGAEVLVLGDAGGASVPLEGLMASLGKRGMQSVLIEGGPALAWSAARDGVIARFVIYLASKLIGGTSSAGVLGGEGISTIADAIPLRIRSVERLGDDLKVVADVHGDH